MSKSSDILVVVTGRTELIAFRRWFPKKSIKWLSNICAETSPSAISQHFCSIVRSQAKLSPKALLVLDRESRTETPSQLSQQVMDHIQTELEEVQCDVVFADRMVENWMLADINTIKQKKYINSRAKQRNYDGTHGVNELKRLFPKQVSYSKTKHGVELLGIVKEDSASVNSPSFARFKSFALS